MDIGAVWIEPLALRNCPTDEQRTSDDDRLVEKFSVVSIEERLAAWRELEQAAYAAEHAMPGGQAASDPRVRDIYLRAVALRKQADQEFAAIVRLIKMDELKGDKSDPG
jgi:hypothetical protein